MDADISGTILYHKDKRVIQLTDKNVRVLLYPKTIAILAENVYDLIKKANHVYEIAERKNVVDRDCFETPKKTCLKQYLKDLFA